MKNKLLYTFLFILISTSIYLIGYLTGGGNGRNSLSTFGTATLSRFTKPQEIQIPRSLLDKLPSEKVSSPKLSLDGRSIIYYDATSGYLHEITLSDTDSKDTALQKLKPYLQDLNWSWDRKLLSAYDGADYVVYDLDGNSFKILNRNIKNPAFSPFEDKAGYIWNDPAQNTSQVSVSNTSFEFFKNLIPVRGDFWKPSWNSPRSLSLEYKDNKTSDLFILDTETKSLTQAIPDKDNLETKWSPDGSGLLYSYLSGGKFLLHYSSLTTGYQGPSLPKSTSASKCTWSIDNETIYCAVDNSSNDEFFSFNTLEQTLKTLKTDTSIKVLATDLFLSADEHYLFFKNSFDNSLYRLKIEW